MRHALLGSLVLAAAGALPGAAAAVTIDFETAGFGLLTNREPGTEYEPAPGVTFGGSAFAAIDADNPDVGFPGSGNFARAPSPIGALTFYGNVDPDAPDAIQPAIVNYASGFNVGVAFAFSTIDAGGSVQVWSGLDGTGTLLASTLPEDIPALGSDEPPFPGPGYLDFGAYNRWSTFTLQFAGIGQSIVLGGGLVLPPVNGFTVGNIFYDDISFSMTPVPEPSAWALMLLGVAAVAGVKRRNARRGAQGR